MNSPSVNGINSSREEESVMLLLFSGRVGWGETSGGEGGVAGETGFRAGDPSGAGAAASVGTADSVETTASIGTADSVETAAPAGIAASVGTADSGGIVDETGTFVSAGLFGWMEITGLMETSDSSVSSVLCLATDDSEMES